ncbi:WD40 repeat-like protein [Peniophora sp. CONT]|nr:WD40 repeat-like protein [Peniophora sp. CONT]
MASAEIYPVWVGQIDLAKADSHRCFTSDAHGAPAAAPVMLRCAAKPRSASPEFSPGFTLFLPGPTLSSSLPSNPTLIELQSPLLLPMDDSAQASSQASHGPNGHLDERSPATQSRTCDCSEEGRNLVICIDGTANEFGEKNTNVIELYSLIPKGKGDRQRTYYNSGIGTYARPSWKSVSYYKHVLGHKADLAIAWNFSRIVLDAYRWLSETYKDGDRIFLFGFSRGAYQVRVLSAMIDKVGLIDRGNEKQIPFAYQWYTNTSSDPADMGEPMSAVSEPSHAKQSPHIDSAKRFKEVFSRDIQVHFVGAWDTVSSIGIVRGRKLLPGTTDGMKHVCHFRHALALDERRVKFLPEYANGGAGPSRLVTDSQRFTDTKEVWFAGTHSDVGGGNIENENLDSARPALRWMYAEASAAGLRLDLLKRKLELSDNGDINVHKSLTGSWWLLEYFPLRRLTYNTENGMMKDTTRRPHRGGARVIQKGQKIHPSVWLSEDLVTQYIPYARLQSPDGKPTDGELWRKLKFWSKLKGRGDIEVDGTVSNPWKEIDLYELVRNLVQQYTSSARGSVLPSNEKRNTQLESIRIHASSGEGWRALSHEVGELLNGDKVQDADILCNILDVLLKNDPSGLSKLTHGYYGEVYPRVFRHLTGATEGQKQIARRFLAEFTDPTARVLMGHTGRVTSVAFPRAGDYIVSCSMNDHTIRVWDATTGHVVGKPFEGNRIYSVAFSPDGKRIASGSLDHTVRMWDVGSGQAVGKPFEGHARDVNSVAFSSDGSRIVSGSDDCTIRIWNAKTGKVVAGPFEGHDGAVNSVAFSPDGTRIVSGSDDNTIRIWDIGATQKVAGQIMVGHTGIVTSVAFSPDGRCIASGSSDQTVRIWDPETGGPLGKPFEGHRRSIYSVAFSPNGTRVVSASNDTTIRFWDVDTGKMVGKPFVGHRAGVTAVAFSPDGTRIISSSIDHTIRIWDVLKEPL